MSEMVERVARALFRCGNDFFNEGDPVYARMSHLNSGDPEHWRSKARAAIAEMREPTGDMKEAGANSDINDEFRLGAGGSESCWQAMIDEALK